MDWSVVFAIVILATVLQLAFFLYYLRSGQRTESVYPRAAGESMDTPSGAVRNQGAANTNTPEEDGTSVTCTECGYDNPWDPIFTYCANCTAPVGR